MASEKTKEFVCFYMEKFIPHQQNLILQGDATVSSEGKLRLTKVDEHGEPVYQSVGRALYMTPVHIRNSETGNVASFFTCFSFSIHAPDVKKTADGLAFFLSPPNDKPKEGGGYLGLFNPGGKNGQVVAVEFDTFINKDKDIDDRNYLHIGLNFMSIKSRQTVPWGFENDNEAYVYISYDTSSASNNALEATLVYPSSEKSYPLSVKDVDLRDALPEWVRVGFSAATGKSDPAFVETHDVNFWFFASAFEDDPSTLAQALKGINPRLAAFLPLHFRRAK
ncbi:hypothetical protein PIB30_038555 [Stylosanthes scabra]|uniref:Legume lectin domain-containing protein n=1 Tax=Stylosanthes scabra TaxID=79078 RepID=A0ABU6YCV0_9FABA|nr:hypothetical protein [Stylosanthes scabra]